MLNCDDSDLIHFGATGRIEIHVYVQQLQIEWQKPFRLTEGLEKYRYSGLAKISNSDVARCESDGCATVKNIWLPCSLSERRTSVSERYFSPDAEKLPILYSTRSATPLFLALYKAQVIHPVEIYNEDLIITAENLEKAKAIIQPMGNQAGQEYNQQTDKTLTETERFNKHTDIKAIGGDKESKPSQKAVRPWDDDALNKMFSKKSAFTQGMIERAWDIDADKLLPVWQSLLERPPQGYKANPNVNDSILSTFTEVIPTKKVLKWGNAQRAWETANRQGLLPKP